MNSTVLKVLHVVNISFVLPYYIGDQFDFFSAKGVEFYVACSSSDHLFQFSKQKNIHAIPLPVLREIRPWIDLKSIFVLHFKIKEHKINIVIGHTPKGAMIAMIAAYLAGVKKRVYFRHGLMYETSKGLKRYLLKKIEQLTGMLATDVVCVSESVMRRSDEEKLNDPGKNILLNRGSCNGIDVKKFSKTNLDESTLDNLKHAYKIRPTDFVVGYVGRLVNDKGINELIKAWKIISKNDLNLKLLLVGPFEDRDALCTDIKNFILIEPSIIYTGLILDVHSHYGLMNVFILPSYREGFPTVVLEASAMELPVITTKSTGCIDSIIEDETGVFCKIEPLSIIDKILTYADKPDLVDKHGINGRAFVVENFEQSKVWSFIEKQIIKI